MYNGKEVHAGYTDLSKAFDSVNHRLLIVSLRTMMWVDGGSLMDLLGSYLSIRSELAKVCDLILITRTIPVVN